jgi:hypothetical protein
MSSVDSIVDVNIFSKWIGLQTNSSKNFFNKKIKEWSHNSRHLNTSSARFRRFKDAMKKDPTFYNECNQYFKEISTCEKELNNLSQSPENRSYENFKLLWSLIVFERWFTLTALNKHKF